MPVMKVVHLCQSADPNVGGSLTVARALVRAQRALGVEAWLVCLYPDDPAVQGVREADYEITCGVSRLSRWSRGLVKLRGVINRLQPDIIHHHDGLLWPRLALLGWKGVRITHGHLGCPSGGLWSSSFWTHRLTMASTDCLIAISPWVAASWEQAGFSESKIRRVPNGVDCERFFPRSPEVRRQLRHALGIDADRHLLLWAGRLDRQTKGLDRLVATAQGLSAEVQLVIAGGGSDAAWLQAELQQLPLGRRPLILGKVPDPAELFGMADSFLFTSKVEPFGLVLLEAVASGLPIFAFDCVGGGRELLVELAARVVGDTEVGELVQVINRREAHLPADILERVRNNYSWKNVAVSTVNIYEEWL